MLQRSTYCPSDPHPDQRRISFSFLRDTLTHHKAYRPCIPPAVMCGSKTPPDSSYSHYLVKQTSTGWYGQDTYNKLRFVTRIVGTRATPLTTLTGRILPGCLLQESFGQYGYRMPCFL